MDTLPLQKLCRICLKTDLLVSIYSPTFLVRPMEMIEKLHIFKQDDGLSTLLCQSCLYRLVDAYNLQQLAEASERHLREYRRSGSDNCTLSLSAIVPESASFGEVGAAQDSVKDGTDIDASSNASIYANICDMFEERPVQPTDIEVGTTTMTGTDDVANEVEIDVGCLTRSNVGNNDDAEALDELHCQHLTQTSNLTQPGKRRFQCEICANFFTTSSNLKAHRQTHLDTRDYSCTCCGRSFKSRRKLRRHEPVHKTTKDFVCELCQKAFTKSNYLAAHMSIHRGIRRHKCTDCTKIFSSRSNLVCHMRIHSGEKPFECKLCSWKFNQSSALARHMKKHEKPLF